MEKGGRKRGKMMGEWMDDEQTDDGEMDEWMEGGLMGK